MLCSYYVELSAKLTSCLFSSIVSSYVIQLGQGVNYNNCQRNIAVDWQHRVPRNRWAFP